MEGFRKRMKFDRNFRGKILSAWKSGGLLNTLLMEGYTFSLEEFEKGLPQVRTGIQAGSRRPSCVAFPGSNP